MRKSVVIITPILIIGLAIVLFALSGFGHQSFGILRWSAYICAGFAIVWIIATALNIALFAPMFWLLGIFHSKRIEKKAQHEHDA